MIFTDVHWSTVCAFSGFIGFVESLLMMSVFGNSCLPESIVDRLYIILIGILSFFGQVAFVNSTKFENASSVSTLRKSFDVILALIFQWIFFKVFANFL